MIWFKTESESAGLSYILCYVMAQSCPGSFRIPTNINEKNLILFQAYNNTGGQSPMDEIIQCTIHIHELLNIFFQKNVMFLNNISYKDVMCIAEMHLDYLPTRVLTSETCSPPCND